METKKSKKSKNKKLEFILSWMQICICSLFPRTESFYSLRLLEEFLYDQYCLTQVHIMRLLLRDKLPTFLKTLQDFGPSMIVL